MAPERADVPGERIVRTGEVYMADEWTWTITDDDCYDREGIYNGTVTLDDAVAKLVGKRVRVTVEVLPDGDYRQARGAVVPPPGAPDAAEAIRRLRDGVRADDLASRLPPQHDPALAELIADIKGDPDAR